MILIDPPNWPAHGRLWSHLASDVSLAELHAFAAEAGIPERAFETDHYDVPIERYETLIAAGARPVTGRELLAALVRAGLRRPRRKGEQVIASRHVRDYLPGAGPCRVDVLTSQLPVPVDGELAGWAVHTRPGLVRVGREDDGTWRLPVGVGGGRTVGCVRVRLLAEPAPGYRGPRPWIFRPALRAGVPAPGSWVAVAKFTPHPADVDVWPLVRLLAGRDLT